MKTIIKGAIYFDGDMLLRPHFSGQFSIVDCTEYKTEDDIRNSYGEEFAQTLLEGTVLTHILTHNGESYYECESGPYNTSDPFELLSDISDLEFYDDETEF